VEGRDGILNKDKNGTGRHTNHGTEVRSHLVRFHLVRVWSGPVTTERGPENGTGPKGPSSCPNVRSYGLAGVRLDLQIRYAIPTQSGTRDGTSSGDWDKSLRPGRTPKVRTLSRKTQTRSGQSLFDRNRCGQISDPGTLRSGHV